MRKILQITLIIIVLLFFLGEVSAQNIYELRKLTDEDWIRLSTEERLSALNISNNHTKNQTFVGNFGRNQDLYPRWGYDYYEMKDHYENYAFRGFENYNIVEDRRLKWYYNQFGDRLTKMTTNAQIWSEIIYDDGTTSATNPWGYINRLTGIDGIWVARESTDDWAISAISANANDEDFIDYGGCALNPTDYSIFYNCTRNATAKNSTMHKWEWITDGDAVLDEDWLGWDELTWEEGGVAIGVWTMKPTCWSDRNYIYVNSIGPNQTESEWTKLRCVSFDGEVVIDKMMHEWFFPDDNGPFNLINGGPNHWGPGAGLNQMLIVSCNSCFMEMIDTTRMLEDPEIDYDEYGVWFNQNGDYFLDMNYEIDSNFPWACLEDEHSYCFKRDSADVDANGFSIVGTSYNGLNAIGVMTQDGTGIDYIAFADDTIDDPDVECGKMGGRVCSSGSNYDGLYWPYAPEEGASVMST